MPGGIVPETQKVLENLKAVLEASGSGIDKVIKATVYLNNISDFSKVNEEYKKGRYNKYTFLIHFINNNNMLAKN